MSTTWPTPLLCVSTMVVLASTWICSVTEPTRKETSMVGLLAICRTMPDWTYFEKPSLLTSSR